MPASPAGIPNAKTAGTSISATFKLADRAPIGQPLLCPSGSIVIALAYEGARACDVPVVTDLQGDPAPLLPWRSRSQEGINHTLKVVRSEGPRGGREQVAIPTVKNLVGIAEEK
jgi:hypothetical protein